MIPVVLLLGMLLGEVEPLAAAVAVVAVELPVVVGIPSFLGIPMSSFSNVEKSRRPISFNQSILYQLDLLFG